jgi:hypothetical protein
MLYSLYISLQPFLQNRDGLPLTSLQPFYKIGMVWLHLFKGGNKIEIRLPFDVKQ